MLINTNLCITTTNPLLRYRFKLRPSYCKSAKAIHIVLPLSWYISLSIYILCIYLDFIAWNHSSLYGWHLFACYSIYPYTFRSIIIDSIAKRSLMFSHNFKWSKSTFSTNNAPILMFSTFPEMINMRNIRCI